MIKECPKCHKEYKRNPDYLRHIGLCDYVSIEQFLPELIELFASRLWFHKARKRVIRKQYTKKFREVVTQRSGGICENRVNGIRCDAKASPSHHLIPIRECENKGIDQWELSILIHLCMDCHREMHPELNEGMFKKIVYTPDVLKREVV